MVKKDARAKLAAELQQEKESPQDWEEVELRGARPLSLVLSIRMRPDEVDQLQTRAAAQGITISELVRRAVHRYFEQADRGTVFLEISGGWGVFQRDASYTKAEADIRETVDTDARLALSA